ncbi:hypothetical protein SDC9_124270 [bioreactor metagenome]|uniref:FlgN protein n=1 Tax=bioreactor metagenome TaxID=1076179 RepID=A0A645CK04_9ZZZZ
MEEQTSALTALLCKLTLNLQRIAALEDIKTKVLIKGSAEELGALLNAQQPLIMQSYNLERQRTKLQESMGMEKDEMLRITENPAPGDETRLADSYRELKKAIKELHRLGTHNGQVLRTRIDTKKNLLRILGADTTLPTYTR